MFWFILYMVAVGLTYGIIEYYDLIFSEDEEISGAMKFFTVLFPPVGLPIIIAKVVVKYLKAS